ncbi:MAG: nicotinate-nucleotide adenylyltransferase [Acidaminobacteraceae bacterium]
MILNKAKGIRIGIMGGTFDPIHNGHLVLAEQIRTRFNLQKIYFIPVGNPPHKMNVTKSTKYDRLNMTKLAIESNKNFEISDIEIKKEEVSYTIDTVREIRNTVNAEDKLYFITGADAILLIDTWKDYKELFEIVTFIGATRPGISVEELQNKIDEVKTKHGVKIESTKVPALAISSTDIRRRVEEGESIKYLLPESVETYIKENGIYK